MIPRHKLARLLLQEGWLVNQSAQSSALEPCRGRLPPGVAMLRESEIPLLVGNLEQGYKIDKEKAGDGCQAHAVHLIRRQLGRGDRIKNCDGGGDEDE
jgi:hypothetical protein